MTAATAILICSFGAVLGWIACQFETAAAAERWAEKPPAPPRSHCRLVHPTALFDQFQDPTGGPFTAGGGGVPDGTVPPRTASSGAARGPGGALLDASRAAPTLTRPSDR